MRKALAVCVLLLAWCASATAVAPCPANCACRNVADAAALPAVAVTATTPWAKYSGLIWVHAGGCPACKHMEPTVNKLILEGKPIVVIYAATANDLKSYGTGYIPTTLAYKNGKVVERAAGVLPEATLRQWLIAIKR